MRRKVVIIAEAGVNHNGSLERAKRLVDSASAAKVDFIKFQTFITELSISKKANKANYQLKNTESLKESQYEMVKKLELSFDEFTELHKYCLIKKIGFLSSAFDLLSIDFLDNLGQPFFKIPSGEITNKPYLQYIAGKGKPIILSTGMSNINEIKNAIKVLTDQGIKKKSITVLHCNTEYPTPFQDVNLLAMIDIKNKLKVQIGYSDHTIGIEVPIAAVALGAKVIEKHFTLDRNLPGPDHKASLEPHELKNMVDAIRNIEMAISGDGEKKPSKSEMQNIDIARKSIHLACDIDSDVILSLQHFIMKRPGDGISPMDIDKVIGRKTSKELSKDHKLNWQDLKK